MSQEINLKSIPNSFFDLSEKVEQGLGALEDHLLSLVKQNIKDTSTTWYKVAIVVGVLFVLAGSGFGTASLLRALPSALHMSSTVAGVVIGLGVVIGGAIIGLGAFKMHQDKKRVEQLDDDLKKIRAEYMASSAAIERCLSESSEVTEQDILCRIFDNKTYDQRIFEHEKGTHLDIYAVAYRTAEGKAKCTKKLTLQELDNVVRYLNIIGYKDVNPPKNQDA